MGEQSPSRTPEQCAHKPQEVKGALPYNLASHAMRGQSPTHASRFDGCEIVGRIYEYKVNDRLKSDQKGSSLCNKEAPRWIVLARELLHEFSES
jgi:hypothetical protein